MADILDGTVDEVKDAVREADDLDLEELLEQEKEGKDRKTVKEFLEDMMDEAEEEMDEAADEVEESAEEVQDEVEEELVEEIEEETEGGILGSYSPQAVLTGGTLLGLAIGLLVGLVAAPGASGDMISQSEARQGVQDLVDASGSQATVSDPVRTNGMYQVNISQEVQQGNETTQSTQTYYMSPDGELLFSAQIFGRPAVIDLDQTIERARQQNTNTTQ